MTLVTCARCIRHIRRFCTSYILYCAPFCRSETQHLVCNQSAGIHNRHTIYQQKLQHNSALARLKLCVYKSWQSCMIKNAKHDLKKRSSFIRQSNFSAPQHISGKKKFFFRKISTFLSFYILIQKIQPNRQKYYIFDWFFNSFEL